MNATNAANGRWRAFSEIEQGQILPNPHDWLIPVGATMTVYPRPDSWDTRRDLIAFGHILFWASPLPNEKNPTIAFKTIYVIEGGQVAYQGVNLVAARVVQITMPQFIRGLSTLFQARRIPPSVFNPSTLILSSSSRKAKYLNTHIDAKNLNGMTGLIWAVLCNDAPLVQLLVAAGSDVQVRVNGMTALDFALAKGHTDIAEILTAATPRSPSKEFCKAIDPATAPHATRTVRPSVLTEWHAPILNTPHKKPPSHGKPIVIPVPSPYPKHFKPSVYLLHLQKLQHAKTPLEASTCIFAIARMLSEVEHRLSSDQHLACTSIQDDPIVQKYQNQSLVRHAMDYLAWQLVLNGLFFQKLIEADEKKAHNLSA